MFHTRKIFLRVDDTVKVAAVSDVQRQFAQSGTFHFNIFGVQVGFDVPDLYRLDFFAFLYVFRQHQPCRHFEAQFARCFRRH